MNLITVIALRRIKRSSRQCMILFFTIVISMALISMLMLIGIKFGFQFKGDAYLKDLPFTQFVNNFQNCLEKACVLLIAATAFALYIHFRMRLEDNASTVSVLSSVGATVFQKSRIMMTEMIILYFPASFFGVVLGAIGADYLINIFLSTLSVATTDDEKSIVFKTIAALVIVSFAFVSVCCFLPGINRRNDARIVADKKSVDSGYKKSKTFSEMIFVKRLAHKSTEYYAKYYRRISLSFVMSVIYPAIGILLFIYMSGAGVIVDSNPFDGVDTSQAVLRIVDSLLLFVCVGFLLLTIIAVIQTVSIIKGQIHRRKAAMKVYNSVGMSPSDCRRLMVFELQSVILRSLVCTVFVLVFINFFFQI